ncbi:MAG TPA: metal-dependent hydrolase [Ktedonobacteraceae bacterium]|nr:metal-dependent hydrolase [Ktedonobacteraceae bacterium]
MQGPSHVGFSLAGAVTFTSLLGALFPERLPGVANDVVHAVGSPWSYPVFLHWYQTGGSVDLASLVHKLSFYVVLAWCARLPDQMERRPPGEPRPEHRAFTHSCLFVTIMIVFFAGVFTMGMAWLASHRIVLADFWIQEVFALFQGLVMAVFFHILADSLTTRKVKAMWPDNTSVGLGMFNNKSAGEYIVLWGYIFLVGALVALGIFGF